MKYLKAVLYILPEIYFSKEALNRKKTPKIIVLFRAIGMDSLERAFFLAF